jgi:hypothetical protein
VRPRFEPEVMGFKGMSDDGGPFYVIGVPAELPKSLEPLIVNVTALGLVDWEEAANVDWSSLSNVDVGKIRALQDGRCKDDEGSHCRVGRDPLSEIDRVAVVERVISTLGLSDVPEDKWPAEVIRLYADTELRPTKLPVGMVSQADAISESCNHPGFGNVVVDHHSHRGQITNCFEWKESRLDPTAKTVQVGDELLDASGHLATLATSTSGRMSRNLPVSNR